MSRRALKGINWAAIAERVSESERPSYVALKSKSDQYLQRVMAFPEEPMKIDWAFYKQQISVPGMVDKFKKEYESLNIPYPADKYTADIEAKGEVAMQAVKQFIEESNERIAEYKVKLEEAQKRMPVEDMTLEEFAEAFPEDSINIDKPTIWPHNPEDQPTNRDVPEPLPKAEH